MSALPKRRPTRRDLLIVITRLQDLVSDAVSHAGDDRDPNRFGNTMRPLKEAHELCIDARGFDPPLDGAFSRHGWSKA